MKLLKLRRSILTIMTMFTLTLAPVAIFAGAASADPPAPTPCPTGSSSEADAQTQVLKGVGQTGSDCSDAPVNHVFKVAVQILSIIVGVASVIVIIFSGFKYIASAGDANKVSNAKSTLIYALVGLAVAGLAQILVHLVLSTASVT